MTALPPCCSSTVARVQSARSVEVCTCGEAYRWSGVGADARVRVADDARLAPSTTPPVARLTHVEDAELVRVRRLLCELRPDKGGPLGWAADGAAPVGGGSAWTPALRVQTSVEVPAILPGAFASTPQASRAPDLDHGYPAMPDDVRATLRWCQRAGTLAEGLRALYTACALSRMVSTAEERDAWTALPEGVRPAARVVYGRKRVMGALAWWADGPAVEPTGVVRATTAQWAADDAMRASTATGDALARALDSRRDQRSNSETGTPLPAVDVRPARADTAHDPASARPVTLPA